MTDIPNNSIILQNWTWLKAHFILLLLAAGLAVGAVYFVDSLIAKHDLAAEQRADAKLISITAQTTLAQNQLATTQQQLLVMIQQLQSQNAQLAQSIIVRNTQTTKQVKTDATLSTQEAAQRLATQTQAISGEITVSGNDVNLTLPVTRRIVSSLDVLATTQMDLLDVKKELENETTLFEKSQETNRQQATVIADLKSQNAAQVTACAAEVKVVKAEARKSKIKWFGIGFISGFITGTTAHLW